MSDEVKMIGASVYKVASRDWDIDKGWIYSDRYYLANSIEEVASAHQGNKEYQYWEMLSIEKVGERGVYDVRQPRQEIIRVEEVEETQEPLNG